MAQDGNDSLVPSPSPKSSCLKKDPGSTDRLRGQEYHELARPFELFPYGLRNVVTTSDIAIVAECRGASRLDLFAQDNCQPFIGRSMANEDLIGKIACRGWFGSRHRLCVLEAIRTTAQTSAPRG